MPSVTFHSLGAVEFHFLNNKLYTKIKQQQNINIMGSGLSHHNIQLTEQVASKNIISSGTGRRKQFESQWGGIMASAIERALKGVSS